jgi:hypothetical protein
MNCAWWLPIFAFSCSALYSGQTLLRKDDVASAAFTLGSLGRMSSFIRDESTEKPGATFALARSGHDCDRRRPIICLTHVDYGRENARRHRIWKVNA